MTSSGQIFPAEIWINIFEKLKDSAGWHKNYAVLTESRKVCKFWKPLVERVMLRVISISGWKEYRLLKLKDQLTMRPELRHLIQDVMISGGMYDSRDILRDILHLAASPSLTTVWVYWAPYDQDMLLSAMQETPDNFRNLKSLPYAANIGSTSLEMYRIVAKSLQSITIPVNDGMKPDEVATRTELFGRFEKLRKLEIRHHRLQTRGRIDDLDGLLNNCRHLETLHLDILEHDYDIRSDDDFGSDISLMDVKKLHGLKRLNISFEGRTTKLRDTGPDWIGYLTTKYSKIETLMIEGYHCKFYYKLLPSLQSVENLKLTDSSFDDYDRLKSFIDVLKSVKNTIRINFHGDKDSPAFKINVSRSRQTASTAFAVDIQGTDLSSKVATFLKLCSDMVIQHLYIGEIPGEANTPLMSYLESVPSVESLKIHACEQYANLHSIETFCRLEHIDLTCAIIPQDINELADCAPNLKHLKFTVWVLEENGIHLPHTRLSSLVLHVVDRTNGYLMGAFFRVSTDLADQIFFARPSQPLLQASLEDYQVHCSYFKVLEIKCKSLDRLDFKAGSVKFKIEFNDLGHWKQGVPDAMNPTYASLLIQNLVLQEKCKTIKKEQRLIEKSYTDIKAKYSRAKAYLSDAVIKVVEKQ